MRYASTHHGLHAFVGVGPFSILKLRNHGSSPFNVSDAFPVPRFRRRDVRELFVQYANVKVDQEIPDAIYDLTNGHPGLISFCGKRISEELVRGRTLGMGRLAINQH